MWGRSSLGNVATAVNDGGQQLADGVNSLAAASALGGDVGALGGVAGTTLGVTHHDDQAGAQVCQGVQHGGQDIVVKHVAGNPAHQAPGILSS